MVSKAIKLSDLIKLTYYWGREWMKTITNKPNSILEDKYHGEYKEKRAMGWSGKSSFAVVCFGHCIDTWQMGQEQLN